MHVRVSENVHYCYLKTIVLCINQWGPGSCLRTNKASSVTRIFFMHNISINSSVLSNTALKISLPGGDLYQILT